MINFEISGRRVKPENIADTLESSMLKAIAGQIRKKNRRDPRPPDRRIPDNRHAR